MKKIVISFLSGALLMFSGQALAGPISNIGKKIEAEYVVIVDGKELDSKAIASSGTTYTPNRAIADAIGYDVKFENQTVIYTKKEGVNLNDPATTGVSVEGIDFDIRGLEIQLKNLKGFLDGGFAISDESKRETQNTIAELEARIKELEAQKAKLQAQTP
ncbi:hypothetical protein SD71_16285 [Cohnella kolymensis]|uniref:Copper amine oxidase-like N-terminal domain-containing protein n=1 Tax=Cohnella kolymensis TaxID=1590652 RepID=A0ABR5A2F8_9BACL|nr:hypothetical protein [Cohnella kolymensis]KIL35180.1 hypothetical protein SD71_16285 [Cohnella kolymensis]